jgi:hypothetical protein
MSTLFHLYRVFSSLDAAEKLTFIRTAQKCQNIVTLEDERGALGSWYNSNRLQWLGFGLPVRP